MSRIIWLASYPKSGNTWFRAFLSNYLANEENPVSINRLKADLIASSREQFDLTTWAEASELTAEEIESNRPSVFREMAAKATEDLYIKAHDAYTVTAGGQPLFPSACSFGAVYFVRNPLDVAVSLSHHLDISLDAAIERMSDRSSCLAGSKDRLPSQLRQRLLSWSMHVESWVDQREIPMHVMRYEDMLDDALSTFGASLEFLGFEIEPGRLNRALEYSSFESLRKQEEVSGFRERPSKATQFFRKGKAGEWRTRLNAEQIRRIIHDHREVMHRFRYEV